METQPVDTEPNLAPVLVHLLRGVVEKDRTPDLWIQLLTHLHPVRDYFRQMGLVIFIDESEGYAFLRQVEQDPDSPEIPALIPRRQMGFVQSLLCVLLRKKMLEMDAAGTETRLILTRDEIREMIAVFLAETASEARISDRLDTQITRLKEMGILRPMAGDPNRFEIRRVLKALVDAQWLNQFDERLAAYEAHVRTLA